MNTEQHYKEHEGIINSLASKFSNGYCDFDELKSQGNLIYMESLNNYKKDRDVKFSTYLYSQINCRLKNHVNNYSDKNLTYDLERKTDSCNDFIHSRLNVNSLLKKLSKEAKEIIFIVFSAPNDLIEMSNFRSISISSLRKYLVEKRGWSQYKATKKLKEIKFVLKKYL